MDGHYDRDADIAWVRFEGWDKDRVRVERTGSGLIERDVGTGRVLGLEIWNARKRLPKALLDALPSPPTGAVVIDRRPPRLMRMIRFAGFMLFTAGAAFLAQRLSAAGHWGYFVNLGAASLAIVAICLLYILSDEVMHRRLARREGGRGPTFLG